MQMLLLRVSGAKHSALDLQDPQLPAEMKVTGSPLPPETAAPLTWLQRSYKLPVPLVVPAHINPLDVQLFSMIEIVPAVLHVILPWTHVL